MILWYLEAKFDYGYFMLFLYLGPTILQNIFQIILMKIEGMTADFAIYRVDITYPPSHEGK